MIESWQVRDALRPRLGTALTDDPDFCEELARTLRAYAPYRDSFADLAARLEDRLFNLLYERLGPGMAAKMDSGDWRRIRTAELQDAADDLLGVLFDDLKVYSVSYEALHAYCMDTGSFSALRVLYTRYDRFMEPGEKRIIARIIRDNYPSSLWEKWLNPADL
ncbi:MAG: hypothetical protein IJI21_01605 [Clostridia bacterium]|nr:hypothetical protein [Clostridia bacterium]